MLFNISPLRMHPKSFEHEQNIPASQECARIFGMHSNFKNAIRLSKNIQQIFIPMAIWFILALV